MKSNFFRRNELGNTPRLDYWSMDSEYAELQEVLIGPMEHYDWQSGNAMSRRSLRLGREYNKPLAQQQYNEMLDVYKQCGVKTHI
ncbi:MAG: amidinotransferase, partial [Paraglaciecola sp.]